MNSMKEDFKITIECPLCNKKSLNVIKEAKNEFMQCISCGYSTSNSYEGTREDNSNFKELDDNMKKWSVENKGKIWIPSILNLPIGLYYPVDDEETKTMKWAFAPAISIDKKDKKKYVKEDGSYYDKRYDTDNQIIFDNFGEGIIEINMVMELRSKKESDKNGQKSI